jgi:hypothetical protein
MGNAQWKLLSLNKVKKHSLQELAVMNPKGRPTGIRMIGGEAHKADIESWRLVCAICSSLGHQWNALRVALDAAICDSEFWATGPELRRSQSQGVRCESLPATTALTPLEMGHHLVNSCSVRQQYVQGQLLPYMQ